MEKAAAAAVFTFLGAYLVAPLDELWNGNTLFAAVVIGLITVFGVVINDCCDVLEDSIGKPERPIPSGRVSRRLAGTFSWSLAAMAIAISALLGMRLVLIAVVLIGITATYSFRLKNTVIIGNASVALLVSCVPLYGALAVGRITSAVWIAAIITFPYVLAQEAMFDLEDEKCDREAGLTTTATYFGVAGAAAYIRTVLVFTMAIALVPWFLGLASGFYLGTLAICTLAPIAFMIYHLRMPLNLLTISKLVKVVRLIWVTSLLPLALLK